MKEKLEKELLTSLGRLLLLAAEKKELELKEARKHLGSQVYTAIGKGVMLGLLVFREDKVIVFNEKAVKLGRCLRDCIEIDRE